VPLCFVSIGSNVEREHNVRGALRALRESFGPLLVSAVYETEAIGFTGDPFYNLVVAFYSEQPPHTVAIALAEIETAHGRLRGDAHHAPRTLDIDLLLNGASIIEAKGLRIPRPEIIQHAFVLQPLAEIAPDLQQPGMNKSYLILWEEFAGTKTAKTVRVDFEL
jgi:2-amino-4-hydroxy-6-hydroxymethyldihydropteridine diphosphokinase